VTDPITCRNCDGPIDGWATFVVYGEFDADRRGFKRGDHNWHVCYSCWHSEYDSKKATTYQTDDPDELWSILAASNGNLVADLSAFYIPGPCYVRVVDGEPQAATVNMIQAPDDSENDLTHEPELFDAHDLILEEHTEDADPRFPVYLVTADETPFAELCDDVESRAYDRQMDDPGSPSEEVTTDGA